jgi:hypothetical protein
MEDMADRQIDMEDRQNIKNTKSDSRRLFFALSSILQHRNINQHKFFFQ